MKKNYLWLGCLALIALMTACQNENFITEDDEPQTEQERIALQASTGSGSDTRLGFDDKNEQGIKVKWTSGDKFTIYSSTGLRLGNFVLSGKADASVATFIQEVAFKMPEGEKYTAVYPASSASTLDGVYVPISGAIQSGNQSLAHLDQMCFMKAPFTFTRSETITFAHQHSMFTVTFDKPTCLNGNAKSLSISMDGLYSDIDVQSVKAWPITAYLMFKPNTSQGDCNREFKFQLISDNGDYYVHRISTNKPHVAGVRYTKTITPTQWTKLEVFLYATVKANSYPKGNDWVLADEHINTINSEFAIAVNNAIKDNAKVNLIMPKLTIIPNNCFKDVKLHSVNFPGVKNIQTNAFENSTLTRAYFPLAEVIEKEAFLNCVNYEEANFPSVTNVQVSAFKGCSNLTSVNFPMLRSLEKEAFASSGLKSGFFPKVENINERVFAECSSLTSISFPIARVIEKDAFLNCTKLADVILPKLENINGLPFGGCTGLRTMIIASEVNINPFNMFIDNTLLKNVDFITKSGNGTIIDGKNWKLGNNTYGPFKSINQI